MKIPTMNRGFAVHSGMTDIRQVTAYTIPHVRASLTRKDKYPRLTIYLNSRCTRLSFESSDICRLLAPSRSLPILSSSLLHSIRCAHVISHRICLSFSFSLLHFLSPSLSLSLSCLSSVAVRETVRIHGKSAWYSMRCRHDCLRRGLSKPWGGTRRGGVPLTRRLPIEYSTYDLATFSQ